MSTILAPSSFLEYGNVGVVLRSNRDRMFIRGTPCPKRLAVDASVKGVETGQFVLVTKVLHDTMPDDLHRGVIFCRCRPLQPHEVSPKVFERRNGLRLFQDRFDGDFDIVTIGRLEKFREEEGVLHALVRLKYILGYRNAEFPIECGRALGAWVETRSFPLVVDRFVRESSEPRYYLERNYQSDCGMFPLILSSCATDELFSDELWDWDFIAVQVEAEGGVLTEAFDYIYRAQK